MANASDEARQLRRNRVIIVGGILLVSVAVFLVVRYYLRHVAQPQVVNLKAVYYGLFNYETAFRRFPPAVLRDKSGRELGSWRFAIVSFVGGADADWEKPWYDFANRAAVSWGNRFYCFSKDESSQQRRHSNIVAVTGPGTMFDEDAKCRLYDLDSDTILLVEVADSGAHWAEPGDLHIDHVPQSVTAGIDGDGFHVVFADRSVWFIRPDVPLDDLRKFFSIDGARKYDRDDVLGPYGRRVRLASESGPHRDPRVKRD